MNKTLSVSLMALAAISVSVAASPVFAENNGVNASVSADVRMDGDRGNWNEEKKEMQDDWNDRRDDMQDKMKDQRNGWMNMFRGKQAEFKSDIKAGWRDMIQARWKFVGNGFENIMARIDSRIDKLEAAGKNTDVAEKHLADARVSFKSAEVKAIALAEESNDGELTQEEKMKAKVSIEADLKATKESLRLSVKALIDLK